MIEVPLRDAVVVVVPDTSAREARRELDRLLAREEQRRRTQVQAAQGQTRQVTTPAQQVQIRRIQQAQNRAQQQAASERARAEANARLQEALQTLAKAGNGQCGLCFLEASSGSIERGTFRDNGVGVAATGTARPAVIDWSVAEGDVGVQAADEAAPVLQKVRIRGASRAAMIWSGRAGGLIEGVTCSDVRFGLVVGPDVTPTVRDSSCRLAPARS